jgi:MFS family permease
VILFLAFLSGTTSGLSKPGAQVQFYDMMPKEKRSRLYLAMYLLTLLGTTGYIVGATLWRVYAGFPFWLASLLIAAATVLYWLAPTQECTAAREAEMSLRAAWRLLREYVNPKFKAVVATMCLLSAGNAVFYYGGMIRMLQTETPGIRISTVTAAVLIMGVVSQLLRKSSLPKMLMMLAGVPVISLVAAACFSQPVVVMILWTLFMGLSFAAQLEIIGQLDSFVEVRSGISVSLYLLANSVGSLLSYMMVAMVGSWFDLRWIYVVYAFVFCSLFFILPLHPEPSAPEATAREGTPVEEESVRPRGEPAPESMAHVETYVRS